MDCQINFNHDTLIMTIPIKGNQWPVQLWQEIWDVVDGNQLPTTNYLQLALFDLVHLQASIPAAAQAETCARTPAVAAGCCIYGVGT